MADGSLHHFKANMARQKARKAKNEGKFDKSDFLDYTQKGITEYDFPKLSDSELEELKKQIRNELKTDQRKNNLIYLSIFLVLVILSWLVL